MKKGRRENKEGRWEGEREKERKRERKCVCVGK